jgi:hypothetical protein
LLPAGVQLHWENLMYYWTGVGSRETPIEFRQMMQEIAHYLELDGGILRSGGAIGADTFFEEGLSEGAEKEIFLHKHYVRGKVHDPRKGYYNAQRFADFPQATEIAKSIHPRWDLCDLNAQWLHSRNIYQVLGQDFGIGANTPSRFLICWAGVDFHGDISGGTRTAWEVARLHGIPRYNLNFIEDFERIEKWLNRAKALSA